MKATLIDRYIYDVGRRLPAKNRADVQMELRSALQDTLDEREIEANNPTHEDRLIEVLREFGEPHKVAAGYGMRRFIVGAELQPAYRLVLRISAVGVTVANMVRLVLAISEGEALGIGDIVSGFVSGFITSFAIVSLIFAIIEYFLPEIDLAGSPAWQAGASQAAWDPRSLPELTLEHDKVDVFEIAVELVFTTAFIYILNAFQSWNLPERLGGSGSGADVVAQLLAIGQPLIPWITGLAVMSIAIRIYLLLRGRWDAWTRWAEIAYYAGSGVIMALLLATPLASGIPVVDTIARVAIGFSLAICIAYLLVMLWRVLRPKEQLPWDTNQLEHDMEQLGKQGERISQAIARKTKSKN